MRMLLYAPGFSDEAIIDKVVNVFWNTAGNMPYTIPRDSVQILLRGWDKPTKMRSHIHFWNNEVLKFFRLSVHAVLDHYSLIDTALLCKGVAKEMASSAMSIADQFHPKCANLVCTRPEETTCHPVIDPVEQPVLEQNAKDYVLVECYVVDVEV